MKKFAKLTLIASTIATMLAVLTIKALELLQQNDSPGVLETEKAGKAIGAGLAVGIAGVGSGIGMGTAGAAGIGAISENPKMFTNAIVFIVLIEAVAIYGLLVALLLIFL